MVKIVRIPSLPTDHMFQGPPRPYTPGSTKRSPPDDKGEARAPEPSTPASKPEEPNAPPIASDDQTA